MEGKSWINAETCEKCGQCVAICPLHIPRKVGREGAQSFVELRADRVRGCMKCGHCMAVCPTQSISIDGLSYKRDFFDLPETHLDSESFFDQIRARRSVRVFKNRPVPREMLEKILQGISLAPMGYPPHKVEITVVTNRETVEKALPIMVEMYEKLGQQMANPLIRYFLRRKLKPETMNALRGHVLPSLKYRLPDMKAGKGDTLTRGAPVLFLFHAHRESGNHTEDATIALTYGLLTAHALGLGATAIGLVPPVVERSPELGAIFRIPPENEVVASMIVGYPKYHFKKGIRRELAGVTWL